MALVVFNNFKALSAGATNIATADVRAGLLATTGAGYDNPDLNTVADLLGVAGVAEPAGGERVAVAGRSVAEDDANNRANVAAGTATFAVDAGQNAVSIFYYIEGANDAARNLVSLHDFASSVSLDGGLTVDPTTNWLEFS